MKRCKVCRKKPRLERRVNADGVVFCSDECYEEFDGSYNDFYHPYIDDYEAIRFEYIEWTKSYEKELYKNLDQYGNPRKNEVIKNIECVTEEFSAYKVLGGNDGLFSLEIYIYLIELQELQEVIKNWKCDIKSI